MSSGRCPDPSIRSRSAAARPNHQGCMDIAKLGITEGKAVSKSSRSNLCGYAILRVLFIRLLSARNAASIFQFLHPHPISTSTDFA
jgi:hypothetical protein